MFYSAWQNKRDRERGGDSERPYISAPDQNWPPSSVYKKTSQPPDLGYVPTYLETKTCSMYRQVRCR